MLVCEKKVKIEKNEDNKKERKANWEKIREFAFNFAIVITLFLIAASVTPKTFQNDTFYKVDADCVGMIPGAIDWKLNKQWLDVLAKSGSPLFVSMHPESLTEEIKLDLKEAFKINALQQNNAFPLDWKYNATPSIWNIDGNITEYDFFGEDSFYPLIKERCPY